MYLEYDKTKKKLRAYLYDTTRLNSHLLSSRRECTPSILNFLKILHKRVVESIDVVHAVKRLKSAKVEKNIGKEEQKQLWNTLKNNVFIRFFLSYYTFNLLNVILRVQVHILGFYAYETSKKKDLDRVSTISSIKAENSDDRIATEFETNIEEIDSFTSEDRGKLLSMIYEFFLNDGMATLKCDIEAIVHDELKDWQVHEKTYSYIDLYDKMIKIRRKIEGPRGGLHPSSPLLKYCINKNSVEYLQSETLDLNGQYNESDEIHNSLSRSLIEIKTSKLNPNLEKMINETWDALESMSFKIALEDCLDATFRIFCDQIHTECFRPSMDDSMQAKSLNIKKDTNGTPIDGNVNRISDQQKNTVNEDLRITNQEEDVFNDENNRPNNPASTRITTPTSGIDVESKKVEKRKFNSSQTNTINGLAEENIQKDESDATKNNQYQAELVKKPLAKLIPFLKTKSTEILSQDPESPYLNTVSQINSVDILCNSFFQTDNIVP